MEAMRGAAFVTGSNVRLSALGDLPHDMRIAKMRPGHADRIKLLGRDGVPSRRDIGDPRRMEDRKNSWLHGLRRKSRDAATTPYR